MPYTRWAALRASLWQFPVVCFTLALLTDLAYWRSSNLMWQNFSAWLLFAGLVMGALAVLVGLIDLLLRKERAHAGRSWLCLGGQGAVLVLALVNSLVHAGDGWTAVVPNGLLLSFLTVAIIAFMAAYGRIQRPAGSGGLNYG